MEETKTFSENQLRSLRAEYCFLDDGDFGIFIEQAERLELDPFSRQIYAVKKGDGRMQVLCTIDGLRIVAERSGKYAGQTPAMWCGQDGVWKDVWLEKTPPAACRVGVLRSDFAQPLYAVARFDSYNQGTSFWMSMPDIMISKCAEALALRRAFPSRLSGCYSDAEIDTERPDRRKLPSAFFDEKAFLADYVADAEGLERITLADAMAERDSQGELYCEKDVRTLARIRGRLLRMLAEETLSGEKYEEIRRKADAINAIFCRKQLENAENAA